MAARLQWRWPQFNSLGHSTDPNDYANYSACNYSEVKTYLSIMDGQKPGYYGAYIFPAYVAAVRAADGAQFPASGLDPYYPPDTIKNQWQPLGGSLVTTSPSGATPGSAPLPLALPLTGKTVRSRGKLVHKTPPTGKGHVAFDFFLTQTATQVKGFSEASITHEIMIPLGNWGHYGQWGYRNPQWYDHDVVIDGVVYHVYYAKDLPTSPWPKQADYVTPDPDDPGPGPNGWYEGLQYNFGGLNPNFINEETGKGRIGWKFIVFQHDGETHPVDSNGMFSVDIAKFIAHLATCTDSRGVPVIRNTEYLPCIEVGCEVVYGTGDLLVDKFVNQVASTVVAPLPLPA